MTYFDDKNEYQAWKGFTLINILKSTDVHNISVFKQLFGNYCYVVVKLSILKYL